VHQGRNHGCKVEGDQGLGPNTGALAPRARPKAALGIGCGRGRPLPLCGSGSITPGKVLKTQMLNPAFWWLLSVKLLAFLKTTAKKLGDQSPPLIRLLRLWSAPENTWLCYLSAPSLIFHLKFQNFPRGDNPARVAGRATPSHSSAVLWSSEWPQYFPKVGAHAGGGMNWRAVSVCTIQYTYYWRFVSMYVMQYKTTWNFVRFCDKLGVIIIVAAFLDADTILLLRALYSSFFLLITLFHRILRPVSSVIDLKLLT